MAFFFLNVFIAGVLTVVTTWISWFIIHRGVVVMFFIYFGILCIWPLIKIFAAKKKPAIKKVHRSFSDMVCSVLGMISAWAGKKQSAMASAGKTVEAPSASENENTVQETVKEVEEELKNAGDDPDPDEEIPGQVSFEDEDEPKD